MPFSKHSATTSVLDDDLVARLGDDPWSLPMCDRRRLCDQHATTQQAWLPRLGRLVEPPAPGDSFPAFLLELPPFARLKRAIGDANQAIDLDVGTADELQHFVDRYRDYLA